MLHLECEPICVELEDQRDRKEIPICDEQCPSVELSAKETDACGDAVQLQMAPSTKLVEATESTNLDLNFDSKPPKAIIQRYNQPYLFEQFNLSRIKIKKKKSFTEVYHSDDEYSSGSYLRRKYDPLGSTKSRRCRRSRSVENSLVKSHYETCHKNKQSLVIGEKLQSGLIDKDSLIGDGDQPRGSLANSETSGIDCCTKISNDERQNEERSGDDRTDSANESSRTSSKLKLPIASPKCYTLPMRRFLFQKITKEHRQSRGQEDQNGKLNLLVQRRLNKSIRKDELNELRMKLKRQQSLLNKDYESEEGIVRDLINHNGQEGEQEESYQENEPNDVQEEVVEESLEMYRLENDEDENRLNEDECSLNNQSIDQPNDYPTEGQLVEDDLLDGQLMDDHFISDPMENGLLDGQHQSMEDRLIGDLMQESDYRIDQIIWTGSNEPDHLGETVEPSEQADYVLKVKRHRHRLERLAEDKLIGHRIGRRSLKNRIDRECQTDEECNQPDEDYRPDEEDYQIDKKYQAAQQISTDNIDRTYLDENLVADYLQQSNMIATERDAQEICEGFYLNSQCDSHCNLNCGSTGNSHPYLHLFSPSNSGCPSSSYQNSYQNSYPNSFQNSYQNSYQNSCQNSYPNSYQNSSQNLSCHANCLARCPANNQQNVHGQSLHHHSKSVNSDEHLDGQHYAEDGGPPRQIDDLDAEIEFFTVSTKRQSELNQNAFNQLMNKTVTVYEHQICNSRNNSRDNRQNNAKQPFDRPAHQGFPPFPSTDHPNPHSSRSDSRTNTREANLRMLTDGKHRTGHRMRTSADKNHTKNQLHLARPPVNLPTNGYLTDRSRAANLDGPPVLW